MKDLIKESERWQAQAENDFQFIQWFHQQNNYFDKGCFLSQQAGEKILKSCLYRSGIRKIWGHSLFEMVQTLHKHDAAFLSIADEARRLDRFYIAARYPNGLPGSTPFEVYTREDFDDAFRDLRNVFSLCRKFLDKKT